MTAGKPKAGKNQVGRVEKKQKLYGRESEQ